MPSEHASWRPVPHVLEAKGSAGLPYVAAVIVGTYLVFCGEFTWVHFAVGSDGPARWGADAAFGTMARLGNVKARWTGSTRIGRRTARHRRGTRTLFAPRKV